MAEAPAHAPRSFRRHGSGVRREWFHQAPAGGREAAEVNLRALLGEVYKQAGIAVQPRPRRRGQRSLPGVEWITAVFREFGVERSEVVGDEVIALDAAFKGGPGILQIAGTGSNTIGRAPDGSRECAGGWSSRLGDEGSGYWIGLHAVRRALNAYDREEPTQDSGTVGHIWGTPTMDELVNMGDSTPGPDFAALAPAINQLAEAGDAVALGCWAGRRRPGRVRSAGSRQAAPQTHSHRRSSCGLDRQRHWQDAHRARTILCRSSRRRAGDAGPREGGSRHRRRIVARTAPG